MEIAEGLMKHQANEQRRGRKAAIEGAETYDWLFLELDFSLHFTASWTFPCQYWHLISTRCESGNMQEFYGKFVFNFQ